MKKPFVFFPRTWLNHMYNYTSKSPHKEWMDNVFTLACLEVCVDSLPLLLPATEKIAGEGGGETLWGWLQATFCLALHEVAQVPSRPSCLDSEASVWSSQCEAGNPRSGEIWCQIPAQLAGFGPGSVSIDEQHHKYEIPSQRN